MKREQLDPNYQPTTGQRCSCRPGVRRDNCPACEGTGWLIDFHAVHARQRIAKGGVADCTLCDYDTKHPHDKLFRPSLINPELCTQCGLSRSAHILGQHSVFYCYQSAIEEISKRCNYPD